MRDKKKRRRGDAVTRGPARRKYASLVLRPQRSRGTLQWQKTWTTRRSHRRGGAHWSAWWRPIIISECRTNLAANARAVWCSAGWKIFYGRPTALCWCEDLV